MFILYVYMFNLFGVLIFFLELGSGSIGKWFVIFFGEVDLSGLVEE